LRIKSDFRRTLNLSRMTNAVISRGEIPQRKSILP